MPKLVILAAEAPHWSLGPATKSQDSLQQQKRWSERNLSGSMCHYFFPDVSCRFDTKAFQEFPVSSTKSSNRLSVSSWKGSIREKGINARRQCVGMYYMPCQTGRSLLSCTSSHTFPILASKSCQLELASPRIMRHARPSGLCLIVMVNSC